MSKRTFSEAGGSSDSPSSAAPPKKKSTAHYEELQLGPISTLEELDLKVLSFQNKKLGERLELKRKTEEELRKRVEQLENRQTRDDAVLCIVNRYWNQLDEDIRILLQRFDGSVAEVESPSEATTSFLAQLSSWDKTEMEESLHKRVDFSNRSIGKLLTAYDKLTQHCNKLRTAIIEGGKASDKIKEEVDVDIKGEAKTLSKDEDRDVSIKVEPKDGDQIKAEVKEEVKRETEEEPQIKKEPMETDVEVKKEKEDEPSKDDSIKEEKDSEKSADPEETISEIVKKEIISLQAENTRLQKLCTELHEHERKASLKDKDCQEKLTAFETEVAEMKNKIDELEYDLESATEKVERLDRRLAEAVTKLKEYKESSTVYKIEGTSIAATPAEGVSKNKFNELFTELEEQRELATARLSELEKLQKDHQETIKDNERLKMDLQQLPESVIVETTEYKCLQSQFSVLYNESMQMKNQLEDTRTMLQTTKNTHLRQIEQMESDELLCQKKLRTELIQLEDTLSQVKKEYEMLRIEFEQTLAANEQTGPINREMRDLITSLQSHNQQLKGEVARYRRKLREAQTEIAKLKAEHQRTLSESSKPEVKPEAASKPDEHGPKREESDDQAEKERESDENKSDKDVEKDKSKDQDKELLKEKEREKRQKERDNGHRESELVKDLRAQLKKAQDSQKELKLLLDMYKSAHKEQSDKVQLMASEKRARQEIDDLKLQIRKMQEAERKEKRKLADEDAIRKIKKLEEQILELQKNLAAQKQEEEALLNEIEVTGQAFEDMQEQNVRLLQQLREKDDANFKLMSERIKFNQIHKLLRDEKEMFGEQVGTLHAQVEAQNRVVRNLEEKERILQNNLNTVEKECGIRQQGLEVHKRKSIDSAQAAADLKMHLDKYTSQLKDTQLSVAEKAATLEKEMYKHKRLQEEVASLKRKLERHKKIELAGTADEVLMEEIREYKEQLTCPSCKVKRKDAILTKCFHVFCLECLKTRYETRQRKCPKCNAGFGANDFHRIYLT